MGEIKSTLDIVLEKTRHLSQSSEEKQAQAQKDTENRLEALKENLAQKHNISGSAVVPNLETDDNWCQQVQVLASAVEEKIIQERDRLVGNSS